MKIVEQNILEQIFVVLIAEQCWSATSALLSNQNHKNEFKFIFFYIFRKEIFLRKILCC